MKDVLAGRKWMSGIKNIVNSHMLKESRLTILVPFLYSLFPKLCSNACENMDIGTHS